MLWHLNLYSMKTNWSVQWNNKSEAQATNSRDTRCKFLSCRMFKLQVNRWWWILLQHLQQQLMFWPTIAGCLRWLRWAGPRSQICRSQLIIEINQSSHQGSSRAAHPGQGRQLLAAHPPCQYLAQIFMLHKWSFYPISEVLSVLMGCWWWMLPKLLSVLGFYWFCRYLDII